MAKDGLHGAYRRQLYGVLGLPFYETARFLASDGVPVMGRKRAVHGEQ